jgi:Flp pilus assembly protein TadD
MDSQISRKVEEAEVLHLSGDLPAAAAVYHELSERQPELADSWFGLGTIALQRRDPTAARTHLQHAVDLAPERPEIRFNLAMALQALEQRSGAVEHYAITARSTAGDPALQLQALRRMLNLGAPREALAILREQPRPTLEQAVLAARARAECGDWAGAVGDLQRVVAAAPDDAEAQRELATVAARLHDHPLAIRAFERHLSLIRPGPADHVRHADLLLMAHRPEAATAAVERARTAGGNGPDLALLEARCARLAGDYAACREAAETVLAVRPADGDAWQLRLENADAAELPPLLERCEQLLEPGDEDAGDPGPGAPHRMMIALAAGHGRERLGQPDAAFTRCQLGKEIQRRELKARGAAYEPARQEESFGRILRHFSGRAATAPSAGTERSPVFIVGMPRSGTTLVERILGSFEGVDTAGENEALEFIAHAYQRERQLGRMPAPVEMTSTDWQRLADEYWQRTGGAPRRITDKMPHNFRHLGLIDALFPDAPVLWLRRDPRDVGLSIYTRPFPDGHAYACDLAGLGHFHAQSERLLRHWQAGWPGRILEVGYEALVADPETGTRRIAEHCGLEWTPDCLRFHERTEASFTFSELQVRRPINADGIGRWRQHAEALAPLIEALREGGVELPLESSATQGST